MPIKLYVVHCKRLTARREALQRNLRGLSWNAQWIESFDPKEIPRRHLLHFKRGRPILTVAEISVYLKHLEVFRTIAESGDDLGFVIEDDAVFPAEFLSTFAGYRSALNHPFDMVYYGASCSLGEFAGVDDSTRFIRELRTRSMSGYLITAAASRKLYEALKGQPIGEPIDHAVDRVIRRHTLDVFWSVPSLIQNGSELGHFAHSLGMPWREGVTRSGFMAKAKRVTDRLVAAVLTVG